LADGYSAAAVHAKLAIGTQRLRMVSRLSAVQGLRWLGSTARLVSYSTEKVAHGYRNTLLITGGWVGGWVMFTNMSVLVA
jgi:hypothetical protein